MLFSKIALLFLFIVYNLMLYIYEYNLLMGHIFLEQRCNIFLEHLILFHFCFVVIKKTY